MTTSKKTITLSAKSEFLSTFESCTLRAAKFDGDGNVLAQRYINQLYSRP